MSVPRHPLRLFARAFPAGRMLALLLCGLLLAGAAVRAQDWIFPDLSWKEPDFENRFLGRYGVNAYTEPQMDVENFNIYEGVLAQIEDKGAAVTYLESGIRVLQEAEVEVSGALYFLLASLEYELGHKPEAIEHYITAIKAHPSFLRAYANLGFLLMETGEPDKALPVLLKAVELGANEAQVHGLIGIIYMQKKLHGSALTAFQWALVFNPQNNVWRQGLLQCLIGLERYTETIGVAEEILAFDRRNAGAWINLANLFLQLARRDDAIVHFQTAHALGGGRFQSHAALGSLLFNKKMYGEACDALLVAVKAAGQQEELEQLLDPCLELSRGGHDTLAVRLLAAAQARAGELSCGLDPVRVALVHAAGRISRGELREAQEILEPLARQAPENGDVQLALARVYTRMHRFAEAEARFDIAQTLPAIAYVAFYEHARMALVRGDVARALSLLRQAYILKPEGALAEHIRSLEEFRRW